MYYISRHYGLETLVLLCLFYDVLWRVNVGKHTLQLVMTTHIVQKTPLTKYVFHINYLLFCKSNYNCGLNVIPFITNSLQCNCERKHDYKSNEFHSRCDKMNSHAPKWRSLFPISMSLVAIKSKIGVFTEILPVAS